MILILNRPPAVRAAGRRDLDTARARGRGWVFGHDPDQIRELRTAPEGSYR